ncbi:MAG: NAD(P)H-hydrate dehydratase [Saccharofermentans sp.]|nr:NAD(P)H-hydrate dehydratase [Saccharofermentans sp.]
MPSLPINEELLSAKMVERVDSAHKNDFGELLVCAGSKYMTGALVLATSSALRSGAGLVMAFAPEDALDPVRFNCPCALTKAWGEDVSDTLKQASKLLTKCSAVAIGPGLDEEDPRSLALLELFINEAKALVIDAGGLNILSKHNELMPALKSRKMRGLNPAVLTPHIGEMRRLLKGDVTEESCEAFAVENTCLLVLKDSKTKIYTPHHDKTYELNRENSGMAKGGSGDVLTGLIGGFLAQGMKTCTSGIAGVYFHSKAGIIASYGLGKRGMLPTDVIACLPEAFEEIGW